MIRVPLTAIVFLYVCFFVGILLAAWILQERQRRRRVRRALQYRLRCAICGLEFEDLGASPLATCPRCRQPNERQAPEPL